VQHQDHSAGLRRHAHEQLPNIERRRACIHQYLYPPSSLSQIAYATESYCLENANDPRRFTANPAHRRVRTRDRQQSPGLETCWDGDFRPGSIAMLHCTVGHMSVVERPGFCISRHEDGGQLWVYGEEHTRIARVLQRRAEIPCGFRKP